MILLLPLVLFVVLSQVPVGECAIEVSCTASVSQAEQCLEPFQSDLDTGIDIFATAGVDYVALVCRKYDVASACVSRLLYYCPDINKKYKEKLDAFEYACSHQAKKDEFWPFLPIGINSTSKSTEGEHDITNTAIKASVAAGVTVLLIMVCVMADCISKWRVRRRVQKATKAAEAAAAQNEALIKNAEEMATEEQVAADSETKKV